MHAQKTARDQFGPATDRRPFGDFSKTFPRPLSLLCECRFFGRKEIASQSQAMCDRGFRKPVKVN